MTGTDNLNNTMSDTDEDEKMIREIAARHWQVAPIVQQITDALRELLVKEREFWEREKKGWIDAANAQAQAAHASALKILELQEAIEKLKQDQAK